MKKWESYILPLAAIVLILGIWQAAVRYSGTTIFPAPRSVVTGAFELFQKGTLLRYVLDSLYRVAWGYLLAVGTGVPIGIVIGWYPMAARAVNPLIQIFRPISPLAWMPLAIVWFGVSNVAPIFLIFLGAFFPIVVATMNGVRNVPSMFLQAGNNFGLKPWALFSRVIFPAILPKVLGGLRIALGIAWLVLVAAEMIAVDSGLGYLIIDSRNSGKRYDLVVAGMLLIGVIGLGLDILVRMTEKMKAVRWGFYAE